MVAIDSQIKRGSAELAILSVLAEGALHGYEMAKRIEEQTAGVLKFDMASLYPMLSVLDEGLGTYPLKYLAGEDGPPLIHRWLNTAQGERSIRWRAKQPTSAWRQPACNC